MNYLITGGCGFIGINLIKKILTQSKDHKIRVIDNLSVGGRENLSLVGKFVELKGKNIGKNPIHKMELVVGDIQNEYLAALVCRGADVIVHLAANTGVIQSINNPRGDCISNTIGTFNYLEAARLNKVPRFVFASSGAPLGEHDPPLNEEVTPHPISPYGASKLAGEGYCSAYHASFGIETVVLRFSNIYGPHSFHKDSVVAKFIKHILMGEPLPIRGDGKQTRDFIYIDDLIRAIILSLECPQSGGEIFQIATCIEHTVSEVAHELNELAMKKIGRKSRIVFNKEIRGEVKRNFSDIGKAKKILGFEPRYNLVQGLNETFLWFLNESKNNVRKGSINQWRADDHELTAQ